MHGQTFTQPLLPPPAGEKQHGVILLVACLSIVLVLSPSARASDAEIAKCLDAMADLQVRELNIGSGDTCAERRAQITGRQSIVDDLRKLRRGACNPASYAKSNRAQVQDLLKSAETLATSIAGVVKAERDSLKQDFDCR